MGRTIDGTRRARLTAGLLRATCLSTPGSRLALAIFLAVGAPSTAFSASSPKNFNVANEAQLHDAIKNAGKDDSITFTANITLSANLPTIHQDLTINGGNFTLSGNNQHRGLFVQSGKVAINDLKIASAKAQGGKGGNGYGAGGGGAGLGGALYVANGANVTLSNISLQDNLARGGNGGSNLGKDFAAGGGGGYGPTGADGENGGRTYNGGGKGGGGSGGRNRGGDGSFGGGGGGAWSNPGEGGNGGFGGGGGGGVNFTGRKGGFGGGDGGFGFGAAGGGGAGLGGAIFVEEKGSLTINGGLDISRNAVAGGDSGQGRASAQPGHGFGSGIFLHGSGSFTVAPGAGQTQTISDDIADQTGMAGRGGSWSLVKNGNGTTALTGVNAYTGGTTVNAGILQGNTSSLQRDITINNNASVMFDQAGNGTYAGSMSGNGALFKRGDGEVALAGDNAYTGGTRVERGTLRIASDAKLGVAGSHLHLLDGGGLRASETFTSDRPVGLLRGNGVLLVDAGKAFTLSGVISGSGTLVKSDSGDLILSGVNAYSGGTTVTGGVLRFTNDANLGAAGTGITLNGGLVGTTTSTPAVSSNDRKITLAGDGGIDVAHHPFIWSGSIGGAGQLIKSGDGELELTGGNTYTGGTLVRRGTLRVAADDKLGATGTSITLENNGGLRASETFTSARKVSLDGAGGVFLVDANKALTLGGILGGSGSLTKVGDGTLVLTGANTYAGNIFNNGGTVQGNTTSLRGNIVFDSNADNASVRSVTFDQAANGFFNGNIVGLGSLTKTGAGTLTLTGANTYSRGTTVSAGVLQGTTRSLPGNILNNATLIFDQGFDGTYAGAMTGSGRLVKNGTGKLDLTGTSTVGGGTTINAGSFAVNGRLTSDVTLNNGGTLRGVGNITGNVTDNGGTIEPGNSIGNITVDGNLTWNGGIFEVEISPSGASDRITIVGAGHKVTVHAGILEVVRLPGIYVPNTRYTIISAPAGGIATFGSMTEDFAFLTPTLSFDATNLYLSLLLGPDAFRSAGQTPNQQAVGGALDTIAASGNFGGVVGALAGLPTAQGVPALQALSGEIAAGAIIAGIASADRFLAALDGQGEGGSGGAAAYAEDDKAAGQGSLAALDMSASHAADPAAATIAHRWRAWGAAYGGSEKTGGDVAVGSHDTKADTFGLVGGVSYRLDNTLFGMALGGGWSDFSLADGMGSGNAGTFNAGLYGRQGFGDAYLSGALAYGFHAVETNRSVLGDTLSGEFNSHTLSGRAEAGYRFETPVVAISPYAAFQAISYHLPAYSETSGGAGTFALDYDSDTATATRVELGARLDHAIALEDDARLTLTGRAAWAINSGTDRNFSAGFQALPGTSFTIDGAEPDRNALLVDAGAQYTSPSGLFAAAAFQGEFSSNVQSYSGKLKLGITW